MATTAELKRRMRAFAEQLCSETGGFSVSEETCWLAAVEDMAAEVGDAVATALIEGQSVRDAEEGEEHCPKCGRQGRYRGPRKREFITRRGPATISEPEYLCPCCRKSFFPNDSSDGR
jgi:hypothetical protein